MSSITLIAGREISTRIRSKAFVISTLITVLLLVAVGVVPTLIGGWAGGGGGERVVTTSAQLARVVQPLASSDAASIAVATEAQATSAVAAGDASIGLTVSGGKTVLLTNRDTSSTLISQVTSLVVADAQATALAAQGVDTAALNAAVAAAAPSQTLLGDAPVDIGLTVVAFAISLLLFMQLLTYGATVAQGVVEEKQSRVVELLLSTVTARQLLIGKVIGIGAVGLVQLSIFLGTGVISASSAGLLSVDGETLRIAAICIAWFIPGYLFYAFAYAGAGALVSRVEEIGQSTTVLTLFIMLSYIAVVIAMQDITAPWVPIVSMIPPLSAILMPMAIAAGVATWWQIAVSLGLLLLATAGVSLLGARIYRRSVLRMGARVPWREALFNRG